MPEEWDGAERRNDPSGAYGEIVEKAAVRAAQYVAQIHRRRLVVQAFLAAVIISTTISVAVVLATNAQRAHTARINSEFNCVQSRNYADVFREFIDSDADLRHRLRYYSQRAQVLSGFERLLGSKLLKQLVERSDRLERNTIAKWRRLTAKLDGLVAVNCSEKIK